jgi:hypothetical protein
MNEFAFLAITASEREHEGVKGSSGRYSSLYSELRRDETPQSQRSLGKLSMVVPINEKAHCVPLKPKKWLPDLNSEGHLQKLQEGNVFN